ncbi:Pleckstrin-like, plant [Dillenia turbinata]|uniref:Pleckstrin-like, plant n=1 Tax=Dillenia turbinata TaxID=194707 RepID=A0AAN8V0A8_9MAGN
MFVQIYKPMLHRVPCTGLPLVAATAGSSHGASTETSESGESILQITASLNYSFSKLLKIRMKEKPSCSQCQSLEVPKSPTNAMEFLCRSWSPSATDFLQILSSKNYLLPLDDNNMAEAYEEIMEGETESETARSNKNNMDRMGNTWKTSCSAQAQLVAHLKVLFLSIPFHIAADMKYMKGWLKGKSLTSFFKCRQEKKKEEIRLHTAKVHAALSVAKLAAAIAGFVSNTTLDETQTSQQITYRDQMAWDRNMNIVVASAAALVAAVCAEAAESAGAHRTLVASAINSGLAAQTPATMVALTATAATSLRGAAVLKSRALTDTSNPHTQNQQLMKLKAQLLVSTPSAGKKEYKFASLCVKNDKLTLTCGKKYLGGVVSRSKEYKVTNVKETNKDAQGRCCVILRTNRGDIKLLFEDPKQSIAWMSTISNLLEVPLGHAGCRISTM